MTPSEMQKEIRRRSGLSSFDVQLVLGHFEQIMAECILREEDSYVGAILKVSSTTRQYSVLDKNGGRQVIDRLSVTIKPRRSFRQRMNHGKIRSSNK